MKRIFTTALILALVLGIAHDGFAKKRVPSKRDVERELLKLGGEHSPEGMKIREVGSIEVGDDMYFHVFSGRLEDDAGYHLIIFDNTPQYVGYYQIAFEAQEVGPNAVMIDTGDFDPATEAPLYKEINIDASGPAARIQINGIPSKFVKPPEPEVATPDAASSSPAAPAASNRPAPGTPKRKPEYRTWHVTVGDQVVEVESAVFININKGNVTIKSGKNGKSVTRPVSDFSEEDKAYLKDLLN